MARSRPLKKTQKLGFSLLRWGGGRRLLRRSVGGHRAQQFLFGQFSLHLIVQQLLHVHLSLAFFQGEMISFIFIVFGQEMLLPATDRAADSIRLFVGWLPAVGCWFVGRRCGCGPVRFRPRFCAQRPGLALPTLGGWSRLWPGECRAHPDELCRVLLESLPTPPPSASAVDGLKANWLSRSFFLRLLYRGQ